MDRISSDTVGKEEHYNNNNDNDKNNSTFTRENYMMRGLQHVLKMWSNQEV